MKKTFRLSNLDCANCAAKMEAGIAKIDGIEKATVSFMTQRLTIECDEKLLEELLPKIQKIIRKIEPNCQINR